MYFVKVFGPSITGPFECDTYLVESPDKVRDQDGVLLILAPAGKLHLADGTPCDFPATHIVYPRGGWTKIVVSEKVEED